MSISAPGPALPGSDGKLEHGLHLLAPEPVKHLDNLIYGQSVFQIFENGGHRNAGSPENPGAADFPGHAFHRGTCRPVERHRSPPLIVAEAKMLDKPFMAAV
jgi:hypothetical protein